MYLLLLSHRGRAERSADQIDRLTRFRPLWRSGERIREVEWKGLYSDRTRLFDRVCTPLAIAAAPERSVRVQLELVRPLFRNAPAGLLGCGPTTRPPRVRATARVRVCTPVRTFVYPQRAVRAVQTMKVETGPPGPRRACPAGRGADGQSQRRNRGEPDAMQQRAASQWLGGGGLAGVLGGAVLGGLEVADDPARGGRGRSALAKRA